METQFKKILEAFAAPGRYIEIHFEAPHLISYSGSDLESISVQFCCGQYPVF